MPNKFIKYIFVLPCLLWTMFFTLFPLFYSLQLAFTDAYLNRPAHFIGLTNFSQSLSDYRWSSALFMTLFFVSMSVILTITLGLLFAWIFNRSIWGVSFLQSILSTPLFMAPIALGYLGLIFFNEDRGPINSFIRLFGLNNIPWFTDPYWAKMAIIFVDVWQWTPFCFMVFFAALQAIPQDFYDSARLETDSEWDLFFHVTIPSILPTVGTVILLRIVETFKVLDIPFSLTEGGPGSSTVTYSLYLYQVGLRNFHYGYASALAYLFILPMVILSFVYFYRNKSYYEQDY